MRAEPLSRTVIQDLLPASAEGGKRPGSSRGGAFLSRCRRRRPHHHRGLRAQRVVGGRAGASCFPPAAKRSCRIDGRSRYAWVPGISTIAFRSSAGDELSDLAGTFNHMGESLRSAQDELRQRQRDLEGAHRRGAVGQSGQEPVSGEHEPRTAHAHERDHRLQRDAHRRG